MDQPWVVVVLVVVIIALVVVQGIYRRRRFAAARAESGPPGSRSRLVYGIGILILVVGIGIARITDNPWWFLAAIPAFVVIFVSQRGRGTIRSER